MPIIVAKLGVGISAESAWTKMMSIISIFAIPATLIEYYFTKERVTEDSMTSSGESLTRVFISLPSKSSNYDPCIPLIRMMELMMTDYE